VAELFRQALAAAVHYRQQRQRAESRLLWTVGLVSGLVAVMGLLAAFLFLAQPDREAARLASEVTAIKERNEGPADKRLSGPLEDRIKKLAEIQANPEFAKLPRELQDYVQVSLRELQAYREHAARVSQAAGRFRALRLNEKEGKLPPLREKDLKDLRAELESLSPQGAYRTAWVQTEAERERQVLLRDVAALDDTVNAVLTKYETLVRDAEELLPKWDALPAKVARAQARKFLERVKGDPEGRPPAEAVVPGSAGVTYGQVFRVPRVGDAFDRWARLHKQVKSWAAVGT
jgi:hypothetical protein